MFDDASTSSNFAIMITIIIIIIAAAVAIVCCCCGNIYIKVIMFDVLQEAKVAKIMRISMKNSSCKFNGQSAQNPFHLTWQLWWTRHNTQFLSVFFLACCFLQTMQCNSRFWSQFSALKSLQSNGKWRRRWRRKNSMIRLNQQQQQHKQLKPITADKLILVSVLRAAIT